MGIFVFMHHSVFCFDYVFFLIFSCPTLTLSGYAGFLHSRLYMLTGLPKMIRTLTYEQQVWRLSSEWA